jgi:CBS domain-containing protein
MTIGEFCNREVVYALRETTVVEAAKLMRSHHVGSLVVVDQIGTGKRKPVGIVTDRDIVVEVTATGLDPKTITAEDIMSSQLATVREEDTVEQTMEMMRFKGVRRLPVVDRDGGLAGIVTIDDLLELVAENLVELTRIISREQAEEARGRK